MEFRVMFKSSKGEQLVDRYFGGAGLDVLDDIKSDRRYKHLKPSEIDVYSSCPISSSYHAVELTEDQAREAGHFCGKTVVQVETHKMFNEFIEYNIREVYHVGKFLKVFFNKPANVSVSYIVNDGAIYEAWKEAGFPLEWK